ncbi:MAG: hypothetical protein AAF141_07690 [Pseudomonadota bacterium]
MTNTSYIIVGIAVMLPATALYAAYQFSGSGAQQAVVTVTRPGELPVWQISRPNGGGCALASAPSPRLARLQLSQTCRVAMPEIADARGWQMMAGGDIVMVGGDGEPLVSFGETGAGLWEANWPPTSNLQLVAPSQ